MIELLLNGWALFQLSIIMTLGALVIVMGVSAVLAPIGWLLWWAAKDEKPRRQNNGTST